MGKICKWYYCCPIKFFVDNGKLEKEWVEKYCLLGNKSHLDNMIPNGEIRAD